MIGCIRFKGYLLDKVVMGYDNCEDSLYTEQEEWYTRMGEILLNESLSDQDRKEIQFERDMLKFGSTCPPKPKQKILATIIMFGAIVFIIVMYTAMRNIFSHRIE